MKILKQSIENFIQINGNKVISEKIVFFSLKLLQKKTLKNVKDLLLIFLFKNFIVLNSKVFSKKKKKKIINFIPFVLDNSKRLNISLKLIKKYLNNHLSKTNIRTFIKFQKIILTSDYKSNTFRNHLLKLSYTQKSFLHYRWF